MKWRLRFSSTENIKEFLERDESIWSLDKAKDILVELSRRGELPLLRKEIMISYAKRGMPKDLQLVENFIPLSEYDRNFISIVSLNFQNTSVFENTVCPFVELNDEYVCRVLCAFAKTYRREGFLKLLDVIGDDRLRLGEIKFSENPIWLRSPVYHALEARDMEAGFNVEFIAWLQDNNFFCNTDYFNDVKIGIKDVFCLDNRNFEDPEIFDYETNLKKFLTFLAGSKHKLSQRKKCAWTILDLIEKIDYKVEATDTYDFEFFKSTLKEKILECLR